DAESTAVARERWVKAMVALTSSLYQQRNKDTQLVATLTLLELPNLLALLQWLTARGTPEDVVALAAILENLIAELGCPQALAQATAAREQAARRLSDEVEWEHTRFAAEIASIDRLMECGQLSQAKAGARRLLDQCLQAGEAATDNEITEAYYRYGNALKMNGENEAALPILTEALRRYATLSSAGDPSDERMTAVVITAIGDCLMSLGRLDDAAASFEEAGKRAKTLEDKRSVAATKGRIGMIRRRQKRYAEALAQHAEAREIYERLGEAKQVAITWHQTAIVLRQIGQFEQAEHALRQSLKIKVQQQESTGEATTLLELGNLYGDMERLADAVTCYRQSAGLFIRLGDLMKEGIVRNNLAARLVKLERYDEARAEIRRALECSRPFGHSASPWATWDILHDLERATGHTAAAAEARARAGRFSRLPPRGRRESNQHRAAFRAGRRGAPARDDGRGRRATPRIVAAGHPRVADGAARQAASRPRRRPRGFARRRSGIGLLGCGGVATAAGIAVKIKDKRGEQVWREEMIFISS
ncbi:MAG: tetratricopeptide repeat protein, partial [Blastocatellia bacterium]